MSQKFQQLKKFILLLNSAAGNSGFTLLEIILYLAIVGILLVAVVNFHFTLGNTTAKVAANIEVANARRTALQTIDYLVANADGLWKDADEKTCSNFVSDPPVLGLYFNDDTYLPGTCVTSAGGGVELTVSSTLNQLVMNCYPSIPNNGQYNACNKTTFPVGNTYYLSPPTIQLQPAYLNFATSTPTSTNDTFLTVTTNLSFNNITNNQTGLFATSTASSTAMLKNEWYNQNSFVGWWKMDDGSDGTVTNDRGGNGVCGNRPTGLATGLVNGFLKSEDFESTESDYCTLGTATTPKYYFKDGFTLAAWFLPESVNINQKIFSQYHTGSKLGYALGVDSSGYPVCSVCNGSLCVDQKSTVTVGVGTKAYHLACVYNPYSSAVIKIYVFLEGTGGQATTTYSTQIFLANYENISDNTDFLSISTSTAIAGGTFVDGVLNDLRAYSRPLSDSEIWALQSRGKVVN